MKVQFDHHKVQRFAELQRLKRSVPSQGPTRGLMACSGLMKPISFVEGRVKRDIRDVRFMDTSQVYSARKHRPLASQSARVVQGFLQ